jgi:hypothetical protein
VLAKHSKVCKLANWSRPRNITFCSSASRHTTEEQAKQSNKHMLKESSTPYYPVPQEENALYSSSAVGQCRVCPQKSDSFGLRIL